MPLLTRSGRTRVGRLLPSLAALATSLWTALPTLAQTDFWRTDVGPFGGLVNSLAVDSQGRIFAATGESGCNGPSCGRNGVFRSTDVGLTWSRASAGLTNVHVNSLFVDAQDRVFAGTYFSGVFRSSDAGASWQRMSTGIASNAIVDGITANGAGDLIAATRSGEIYRSTDDGASWTLAQDLPGSIVELLATSSGTLFAGLLGKTYRSDNGGLGWFDVSDLDFVLVEDMIEASGGVLLTAGGLGVYRSIDGGSTWQEQTQGLPNLPFPSIEELVEAPNGDILASAREAGLYRSTDQGLTWSATGTGFRRDTVLLLERLSVGSDQLFASTEAGILISDDDGASWVASNDGLNNAVVLSIEVLTSGAVLAATRAGVQRSQNRGASWVDSSQGLPRVGAVDSLLQLSGGDLLAGTRSSSTGTSLGLFRSADDGQSWSQVPGFVGTEPVVALAENPSGDLFTLARRKQTGGVGVYRSVDGGIHWVPMDTGLPASSFLTAIVAHPGGDLYVVASSVVAGIYRSTNGGATWQLANAGIGALGISALAVNSQQHLIAGGGNSHFRSTDGTTWSPITGIPSIQFRAIHSLAVGDLDRFVVGFSNSQPQTNMGIGRFDDDGSTFIPVADGFTDNIASTVLSMAIAPDGTAYAGLDGAGVAVPEPAGSALALASLGALVFLRSARWGGLAWMDRMKVETAA